MFGTGCCLRLALVVWSWHGLLARLSICPLENSPVLLESITAPVEEMAITISDGREGERQEPHPFLESDQTYAWNIFAKHHYTNVLLILSVWHLDSDLHSALLLFSTCQGWIYMYKNCELSYLCQCLTNHTDLVKKKKRERKMLPFKSCIAPFCDRLDLEWAKPAPAGGCSPFDLLPELFLLWYVWLTSSMGDW